MPEYKSSPHFMKEITGRTITGIFCVHGNVDEGNDRSHVGLFGDGTVNGRKRAVFLWQHNSNEPAIATIDRIYEVAKVDLPPAVLLYAPDCTAGVAVERTYQEDAFADRVFNGVRTGAIREMSYAYDPTRYDFEEADGGKTIRNLYEAELFDISDCNWGMNPATIGSKGLPLTVERQMALAAMDGYIKRVEALYSLRVVKEGRRFSSATVQEIESTIAELRKGNKVSDEAIKRLEGLIVAPEEPKQAVIEAPERDVGALRRLYLDYQHTLASINGVYHP